MDKKTPVFLLNRTPGFDRKLIISYQTDDCIYTVYNYESRVMNTYTHTHTVNENCLARRFLLVYKCNLRRK